MTAPVLRANEVALAYGGSAGRAVFADVCLEVHAGEVVSVIGPSGAGKSSLLRVLAGLQPATSGLVEMNGRPLRGVDPGIAVAFQDPCLLPWLSVEQNAAFGLDFRRQVARSRSERRALVAGALEAVGLAHARQLYPPQLSGGMAQRVALARALVNDPRLLVLDEPLGKLDSLTRLAMQSELVALWQRAGFSALLVTHDVEEALFLAQRVIVFSDRPARIRAEIEVDLPYPRHRGDPRLTEMRHEALRHLGLDASW